MYPINKKFNKPCRGFSSLAGILFFLMSAAAAQAAELWSGTYGGERTDRAFSVQQTHDGGYIMTGMTTSSGQGGMDMHLVKTDKNGRELFNRTFGGDLDDAGFSVQQTADRGFIIVGYTDSFPPWRAVYLVKTDANGEEIWSRTYGGDAWDYGYSVQQTRDGGYIITGETNSFGAGGFDVYLVKTDQDGNEVWSKRFGGDYSEQGRSVRQTSDGGYIIAGSKRRWDAIEGNDVYLIKTDENGDEEWSRTFGGNAEDRAWSVQETSNAGYIIGGFTKSFGQGREDYYLIKTDPYGHEIWSRTFGHGLEDIGTCVRETFDGGFIMAGTRRVALPYDWDMYLVRTDPEGNELWSETFGGIYGDRAYSADQARDGGFVIAGHTKSFGAGGDDVYLVKTPGRAVSLSWSRTLGGQGRDVGKSVHQTSDGGFIVAGSSTSFNSGDWDAYLVKTYVNGTTRWSRTFGGTARDYGYSVWPTRDRGYALAGCTESTNSGNRQVFFLKTDLNGNGMIGDDFGGGGPENGYAVQQTEDSGYIIAGSTASFGAGGYDVHVLKLDKDGRRLWSQTFGGSGTDQAFAVRELKAGGYMVAGYTGSAGAGGYDVYLIKLDANGGAAWERTYGGTGHDIGRAVQQVPGGGFMVAGYTNSSGSGGYDVYVTRTDASGIELWSRTFGGARDDFGFDLALTRDKGFIVAGYTYSFGAGGSDVYLVQTDANGNLRWSETFGGSLADRAFSIDRTSDNGYVVVGDTHSFGQGRYSDVYLLRTTPPGESL